MHSQEQIRVLIWGCSSFTAAAILNVLDNNRKFEVVGCVRTLDELIEATFRWNPAVLIFDADHQHEDPLTVITTFRTEFLQCPVLGISLEPNEALILSLLSAGALGYCLKANMPARLRECIESLAAGESWVDTAAIEISHRAEAHFQTVRKSFDAIEATARRNAKEIHASQRTEDAHM